MHMHIYSSLLTSFNLIDNTLMGILLLWLKMYDNRLENAVQEDRYAKEHRSDLVSEDHLIIIECKSYTWTKSWNVPSAKLAALDEAILYMRCIIPSCSARKIIIMERSFNKKTGETLAEYFVRRKGHLLADIEVMELDEGGFLRLLTCCLSMKKPMIRIFLDSDHGLFLSFLHLALPDWASKQTTFYTILLYPANYLFYI